jgi:hypothetical protein
MLAWVASCVSIISGLIAGWPRVALLAASLLILVGGVLVPGGLPPWIVGVHYRRFSRSISGASFLLIGVCFYVSLCGLQTSIPTSNGRSAIFVLLFSVAALVAGWSTANEGWYHRLIEQLPGHGSFRRWVFLSWAAFEVWLIFTQAVALGLGDVRGYAFWVVLAFLLWVLLETARLGRAWYSLRRAARTAMKRYPSLEANIFLPG